MAVAITFWNYSSEDFTHKWDGVDYTVKSGERVLIQDYIARHLAAHLTMREMNRENPQALINRENAAFKAKMEKCFQQSETSVSAETPEKLEVKIEEDSRKRRGRPKKEKEEEIEFPELNA